MYNKGIAHIYNMNDNFHPCVNVLVWSSFARKIQESTFLFNIMSTGLYGHGAFKFNYS